jgi:hypothetical protein
MSLSYDLVFLLSNKHVLLVIQLFDLWLYNKLECFYIINAQSTHLYAKNVCNDPVDHSYVLGARCYGNDMQRFLLAVGV